MFDIGFWEVTIIGVVALFVIGPEKMPELVRTIGNITGQIRRAFYNLKKEVEFESQSNDYKLLNKEFLEEDRKFKETISNQYNDEKQEQEPIKDNRD